MKLYYSMVAVLIIGGGAVGVIKLMAWWQIAMNGCGT